MKAQVRAEAKERSICEGRRHLSWRACRVDVRRKEPERLNRRDSDRTLCFRHHEHARCRITSVVMFMRMVTRGGVMIAVAMIVARSAGHRMG